MENKIFLLGIGFNNLKINDVLELIIKGLVKKEKKYYVVTPNPEILVLADGDVNYKKVLNGAKLALPDGIGVIIASRLLLKPLRERIHGVDLMENLCKEVSKRPITVGFLGAGPNVAELTAECLREKYPGLKVVFASEEWNEDNFKFQISNQFNNLRMQKLENQWEMKNQKKIRRLSVHLKANWLLPVKIINHQS